jgi:hypothetical protein
MSRTSANQIAALHVCVALGILAVVYAVMIFANLWPPKPDQQCEWQFPKIMSCVLGMRENLAGGVIGAGGALFAAWIAWHALQRQIAMQQEQIDEMKIQRRFASLLSVIGFLQEEHVRKARGVAYDLGKTEKPYGIWTDAEREATELALRRYNRLAIVAKGDPIFGNDILEEFATSLIDCWDVGQPLISALRSERGDRYWKQLDDLYQLAKENGYSGRLSPRRQELPVHDAGGGKDDRSA